MFTADFEHLIKKSKSKFKLVNMKRTFLSIAMTVTLMVSGLSMSFAQDEQSMEADNNVADTGEVMAEEPQEEEFYVLRDTLATMSLLARIDVDGELI